MNGSCRASGVLIWKWIGAHSARATRREADYTQCCLFLVVFELFTKRRFYRYREQRKYFQLTARPWYPTNIPLTLVIYLKAILSYSPSLRQPEGLSFIVYPLGGVTYRNRLYHSITRPGLATGTPLTHLRSISNRFRVNHGKSILLV